MGAGTLAERGVLKGQGGHRRDDAGGERGDVIDLCGRDTGKVTSSFGAELAKASGIDTPTREDLARLDRKERTSNAELIHVVAFTLSLILRKLLGAGTTRELRHRAGHFVYSSGGF